MQEPVPQLIEFILAFIGDIEAAAAAADAETSTVERYREHALYAHHRVVVYLDAIHFGSSIRCISSATNNAMD